MGNVRKKSRATNCEGKIEKRFFSMTNEEGQTIKMVRQFENNNNNHLFHSMNFNHIENNNNNIDSDKNFHENGEYSKQKFEISEGERIIQQMMQLEDKLSLNFNYMEEEGVKLLPLETENFILNFQNELSNKNEEILQKDLQIEKLLFDIQIQEEKQKETLREALRETSIRHSIEISKLNNEKMDLQQTNEKLTAKLNELNEELNSKRNIQSQSSFDLLNLSNSENETSTLKAMLRSQQTIVARKNIQITQLQSELDELKSQIGLSSSYSFNSISHFNSFDEITKKFVENQQQNANLNNNLNNNTTNNNTNNNTINNTNNINNNINNEALFRDNFIEKEKFDSLKEKSLFLFNLILFYFI